MIRPNFSNFIYYKELPKKITLDAIIVFEIVNLENFNIKYEISEALLNGEEILDVFRKELIYQNIYSFFDTQEKSWLIFNSRDRLLKPLIKNYLTLRFP